MKDPLIVGLIGAGEACYYLSPNRKSVTDGKIEKWRRKGDAVTLEGVPAGSHPDLIRRIYTRL